MTGRLLTARQVAEQLGVTAETVLRWIDTRGLPARRLTSRAIRFREDELEAWIDARATADGADREVSPTRNAARQDGAYGPVSSVASPTPPRLTAATEKED